MLQVKSGETDKLGLLYERHKKALYGFYYKMCRSVSLSEDMVQTVFIKILQSKHTFIGNGQFVTWMFHIARNVMHDHYRKNKHAHLQVGENQGEQMPDQFDLESNIETQHSVDHLFQALSLMSIEKRELLVMSRMEGMKYKQIAEIVGSNENAIKVRIHRALKELKSLFDQLEAGAIHVA